MLGVVVAAGLVTVAAPRAAAAQDAAPAPGGADVALPPVHIAPPSTAAVFVRSPTLASRGPLPPMFDYAHDIRVYTAAQYATYAGGWLSSGGLLGGGVAMIVTSRGTNPNAPLIGGLMIAGGAVSLVVGHVLWIAFMARVANLRRELRLGRQWAYGVAPAGAGGGAAITVSGAF